MSLQLNDLGALDSLADPSGTPLMLPIDGVDEDPEQPRKEFSEEALQELAATIRERGVRQPISVRRHPSVPGRWMVNFGARRLRASKLAGLTEIPAFVDNTADSYDQMIENEHRENLQPFELALFVQRRMTLGETQAEIGRRLGKSRGYITFVSSLIDAPPWLMELYRSGRCRGVLELYELRRLGETDPGAIERLLGTDVRLTRGEIQRAREEGLATRAVSADPRPQLKATWEPRHAEAASVVSPAEPGPHTSLSGANAKSDLESETKDRSRRRREKLVVMGSLDGTEVEVDVCEVPIQSDEVFVLGRGTVKRQAVDITRIQRLQLVRGTV